MNLKRLRKSETIPLAKGTHRNMPEGACLMELVSYVAEEPWSDSPACVSPCIAAALRTWNDAMDDEDRQQLKELIPLLIGTRDHDDIEAARAYLLIDWLIRTALPAWLDLAHLTEHALMLRQAKPIAGSHDVARLHAALRATGEAFVKRGNEWAVGWAVEEAVDGSALLVAQQVQEAVPWSAEFAAAQSTLRTAERVSKGAVLLAAARAFAEEAALDVSAVLRPTVVALQRSALDVIRAMCALTSHAPLMPEEN